MTIFTSQAPSVPHYPDDLDLYSFLFEYFPDYRFDVRGKGTPLLIDEETGQSWNYEDCRRRVDLLAVGLREKLGVGRDTVLAIFSANCVDYLIAILACHKLGAIVSAANPSFQPSELSYQLDACKATAIFVGEEAIQSGSDAAKKAKIPDDKVIIMQTPRTCQEKGALKGGDKQTSKGAWNLEGLVAVGQDTVKSKGEKTIEEVRIKLQKGEAHKKLAFLSFSSGTTGLPKGVCIQHYAPISNVLQHAPFNDIKNPSKPDDRLAQGGQHKTFGALPFFHIYGLVVTLQMCFFFSVSIVCVPKFKGMEAMIKTTLKYGCTTWYLVPPQVVLLVKDPAVKPYLEELRKVVKFAMIGAAPLSDDLSSQLAKVLPDADWGQGYGMTETCTVTTAHPIGIKPVLGSAGRLFPDVKAKVVNSEGKAVGVDGTGELWLQTPTMTLGYLNNQKATDEMWVKDADGPWVRTGDEVRFNAEGDMFIVDRLKELIKSKGFQVAPAELEGWILNHEDVSDVGVIGFPSESSGEVPLAFISLASDTLARLSKLSDGEKKQEEDKIKKSVSKFVSDHKIRYKHLGGVEIIAQIPKTASGKILRRDLRDLGKKLPPLVEEDRWASKGAGGKEKL